jgi:hypothetical protein
MGKIDIIIERLKDAPPELVDEIYALMEKVAASTPKANLDSRQGIMKHYGALKDSKAFAGDPVAIQRAMRDEWT